MKQTNRLYRTALLLVLMLAAACTRDDFTAPDEGGTTATPLAVTVADGGYVRSPEASPGKAGDAGTPATRAVERGYATEFTAGDRIGLYVRVANGNGGVKLLHENLCLTCNGTDWTLPAGVKLEYDPDDPDFACFAYYPWQRDKPAVTNPSASAAEGFFEGFIAGWNPRQDQSTYEAYTASDLMVAKGEITANASGDGYTLHFAMRHQMVLAVIRVPTTKYTYTETIDHMTHSKSYRLYSGMKADVAGWQENSYTIRYLEKKNNAGVLTVEGTHFTKTVKKHSWSFTMTSAGISGGTYVLYTIDGGEETETDRPLRAGDFYMSDGTIIPQENVPDGGMPAEVQEDCLGVVFWVGENTGVHWTQTGSQRGDYLLMRDHPECTRGMVVALHDTSPMEAAWATGSVADESLYNWADKFSGFTTAEQADWSAINASNQSYGYRSSRLIKLYGSHHPDDDFPAYDQIARYAARYPAPESSSGWFFPGQYELAMMCYGRTTDYNDRLTGRRDLLNRLFPKAGGEAFEGKYWSAWEYNERAWHIDFTGATNYGFVPKSNTNKVRAVLAF